MEKRVKFNLGEWCFYEFKLHQITETINGKIVEITDGIRFIREEDINDKCYPISMITKQISESVAYCKTDLDNIKNKLFDNKVLNKELIRAWLEMCENKDNKDKLEELYTRLHFFRHVIKTKSKEIERITLQINEYIKFKTPFN